MERHNQVTVIVCDNCAVHGLLGSWIKVEETTLIKLVKNEQTKVLWDFQMQTNRMMVACRPGIVVVGTYIETEEGIGDRCSNPQ